MGSKCDHGNGQGPGNIGYLCSGDGKFLPVSVVRTRHCLLNRNTRQLRLARAHDENASVLPDSDGASFFKKKACPPLLFVAGKALTYCTSLYIK